MQRSTEWMLTTHAGSLPKPSDLDAMLRAQEADQPYDAPTLQQRLARAWPRRSSGATEKYPRKALVLRKEVRPCNAVPIVS